MGRLSRPSLVFALLAVASLGLAFRWVPLAETYCPPGYTYGSGVSGLELTCIGNADGSTTPGITPLIALMPLAIVMLVAGVAWGRRGQLMSRASMATVALVWLVACVAVELLL